MESLRVGEFRKKLLEKGFDFSESKLRHYTELNVIPHNRNDADQRVFSESDVHVAIRNILLYELGVSVDDIAKNNKEVIADKLKSVEEILKKFF